MGRPIKVIIDTDPGVDDAIALLMALACPTVDVVGLTTVGGNVPLARGTRNALALLEYAGRPEVPVARGAARPRRGRYPYAYPFHGPGKPMNPDRLAHLKTLKTPSLFCQGTRDTLGDADDVAGYTLADTITMNWLEDGDHGFKPRKASGLTEAGNWQSAIGTIAEFLRSL